MDNLKTPVANGCVSVKTGPLSVALKARMPIGCDVFEIVRIVEAEMNGQPLNAKTVYTFTEEVRKRVADLIVIEIDDPIIPSNNEADDHADGDLKRTLYEVIFQMKDGGIVRGYSGEDEPKPNGMFYHCAATKELKGRVIVTAENITSFRFIPL
ncbi:hypothetical protein CIG23_17475 [Raoultella planticola]|uniref:hypothetical protein n=1 Tax=Raoultella planticola TaxID=575 RepID=UPI000BA071AA|nr:hypothetical protein [Raoultella planticola]OZP72373.1 hypothetical protein CIG23_17475 [Raoultella planticola]